MKFKKQDIKIAILNNDYTEKMDNATAFVNGYFGYHKAHTGEYNVVHIPTGYKIIEFEYAKQARKFIKLIKKQNWSINWSINVAEKLKLNDADEALIYRLIEQCCEEA